MKITLTQIMQMIDAALALAAMGVKLTPTEKDDEILAKIVELREKVRPLFGADAPEATEVELTPEQAGELKLAISNLQFSCDGCCDD